MQTLTETDTMLVVKNGWLLCPQCGYRRLKRVFPDEVGERISVFCRDCKNEIRIDINQGRCFESRGR